MIIGDQVAFAMAAIQASMVSILIVVDKRQKEIEEVNYVFSNPSVTLTELDRVDGFTMTGKECRRERRAAKRKLKKSRNK